MGEIGTHWLGEAAARTPDKVAARFVESGAALSFTVLDRRATQAAQWLVGLGPVGLGLAPGDAVALLLDNGPAMIELAFAAERAGLYYVPMSTHLRTEELGYILADCRARVVVVTPALAGVLPVLPGVVVVRTGGEYEAARDAQAGAPVGVTPAGLAGRPIGRDVLYSSGTTGRPKGVFRPMLPAAMRGVGLPIPGVLAAASMDASTVYLSTGPLYHAAPHRFTLHAIRNGGTAVVPGRFDAERALALIAAHKVTQSQWVPTMFVRLLALPEAVRLAHDLSSHRLAIHAAAPCPIPVKRAMIDWWGPILWEYYSGSETIGATAIDSSDWLRHPGSVGRAISGQVHVVGGEGEELPAGEVGAVWFSGLPGFEYMNDPARTAAARDARGWATYGDLGHLDGEGYLYLSDRRADLIITGGVNVYPQEVEQTLALHPAVADAGVVGAPDPEMGERVQAVVVLQPGAVASEAELVAFCRGRLSSVKAPRGVVFVEALPRSDVGKLLRRVLKERFRAPG